MTPQPAAHQAPPSLGFSRQEHWSELPFPSPMRESEVAQSCPTLSDPMDCSPPGSSVHGIFQAEVLEWVAIESVTLPNHLIFCCLPLLLLPSTLPSNYSLFQQVALRIRWPKYWSFNISPSNEYLGLISFRTDWLDLLAVQRTQESGFIINLI